ncbi:hypothetical protein N4T57_00060 [Campylobacter hepaticus]|uniref:DUF945 family protein n=2 Tax=Campylobacter hepaticus TaxID=1813019 RepID=A0A6A7JSG5_9BACT|nr:hypothetical protein [Campylobacter hepaticus]AXP09083.1 hypothetical protein A2J15_005150 [Campylobacter hepaticus]MCZ0771574.1 hypothetical protein [Campylobacter hepaticus]MCZ0773042.1 hypothetical protein [Campylobacter hepaticus]MCZ0775722.1 hypothetical protein [Campylobacter hepaticus]MDX2323498.1 hypothetical protein [Campylobacter hepaticus]
MKKWIVLVILLILSFIIYISYIAYVNALFFDKLSKNNNAQISNAQFHKGFLKSYGSFTLKDSLHPNFLIQVNLEFYNLLFKEDIKGEIIYPFDFLNHSLKNNKLAAFTVQWNKNKIKIFLKLEDINLNHEGGNTLIKGGSIESVLNENLEITDIKMHFKDIVFSQFYTQFNLENLSYEQNFDHGIYLYDFNFLSDSKQEISFDSLSFNHNKIKAFHSQSQLKQDAKTLKFKIKGQSKEVNIYLPSVFHENLNFEKTNFNISMDKSFDLNFNFLDLFEKNINLNIENLNFEKNKQDIKTQGHIHIHENIYQAKLQIISSKQPDEIFIWAQNYGGLNQYFFKENHHFILNLIYDNTIKPQLKINGKEFTNMDLN